MWLFARGHQPPGLVAPSTLAVAMVARSVMVGTMVVGMAGLDDPRVRSGRPSIDRAPRPSWGPLGTNPRLEWRAVPAPEAGARLGGRSGESQQGGVRIGGAAHRVIWPHELAESCVEECLGRADRRGPE